MLIDVQYVLGFTHNLLSVAQLIQDMSLKYVFYPTHCIVQKGHIDDELWGVGKMKRNLYLIEYVLEKYYCNFFNSKDMTVQKLHVFLGHPSITTMKHMNIIDGKFHADDLKVLENHEVCTKAKETRDPFPTLNRRFEELFKLVHVDIWEENICHAKKFLTLVEDHSRTIWIYLLQSKDHYLFTHDSHSIKKKEIK